MTDSQRDNTTRRREAAVRSLVCAALGASLLFLGGCVFGALAESYKRTGTRSIGAKYAGLTGKSFAVVVAADRVIQADYPDLVAQLTVTISERLKERASASGYVPGVRVLEYQYSNPRWVTMTLDELAREVGPVERLVFIDLQEYRLHDAGNQYLWNGVASGFVGVTEADGPIPDEYAYSEAINVSYPDTEGLGPEQIPLDTVSIVLTDRFIDRVTWLFFEHEEPYYPDY